jgi:mono/diheme cytochrome c family protein
MGPAPPLNDPLFLNIIPVAEVRDLIEKGRPGTLMPAFGRAHGGPLTPEQVDILAKEIRQRWQTGLRPAKGSLPDYSVDAGADADPRAGEKVYREACARCHGPDGKGDTAGALHNDAFLTLFSDQALRRIVICGRPDLGCPDYRHRYEGRAMTSKEIADVVALLSSWRPSTP